VKVFCWGVVVLDLQGLEEGTQVEIFCLLDEFLRQVSVVLQNSLQAYLSRLNFVAVFVVRLVRLNVELRSLIVSGAVVHLLAEANGGGDSQASVLV